MSRGHPDCLRSHRRDRDCAGDLEAGGVKLQQGEIFPSSCNPLKAWRDRERPVNRDDEGQLEGISERGSIGLAVNDDLLAGCGRRRWRAVGSHVGICAEGPGEFLLDVCAVSGW